MSNLFGNLSTQDHEEVQDRLGGFSAYETDAYTGKIKAAYAGKSDSGAQSMTFIFALPSGEYRETAWVTNKEGKNYYHPKKADGTVITDKKQTLAGYTVANDIALVTVGKELGELVFEEKVMNVYDPDAKKELPKAVMMATELLGQEVTLGIVKQIVDKQQKDASGQYVSTGETREENQIEKVFHHPSNITVVEQREAVKAGRDATPVFYEKWVEKNKGQTRDRSTKSNQNGQSGRPGQKSPPQAGQQTAQRTSLFGNKG